MEKTTANSMPVNSKIKAYEKTTRSEFDAITTPSTVTNKFSGDSALKDKPPLKSRRPQYNAETEAVILESKSILDGTIQTEIYDSANAMFTALDKQRSPRLTLLRSKI